MNVLLILVNPLLTVVALLVVLQVNRLHTAFEYFMEKTLTALLKLLLLPDVTFYCSFLLWGELKVKLVLYLWFYCWMGNMASFGLECSSKKVRVCCSFVIFVIPCFKYCLSIFLFLNQTIWNYIAIGHRFSPRFYNVLTFLLAIHEFIIYPAEVQGQMRLL